MFIKRTTGHLPVRKKYAGRWFPRGIEIADLISVGRRRRGKSCRYGRSLIEMIWTGASTQMSALSLQSRVNLAP
jgi:hypothetical protein